MDHKNNSNDYSANDLTISDLKRNLDETNAALLDNLKNRFTQDLLANMVFTVFNEMCRHNSDISLDKGKNTIAKSFFSSWRNKINKQSKKEILAINNQLKNKKINFLSAISNFSLPSTEDYQSIYNRAISDIEQIFEKNTFIK
jgi:hypothetical protein